MIQNNAEMLKTNRIEGTDLKQMLVDAKQMVGEQEMEAGKAEEDAQSLELELMQAQAAHEGKEEAERKGKETKEKMQEMTG